MAAARLTVTRDEGRDFGWEFADAIPSRLLSPFVMRLCGYREWSMSPVRRLQPPYRGLPLIVTFGMPLRISAARYDHETVHSFVAGLSTDAATTIGHGEQAGVQADLTPLGAARVLGRPLCEVAHQLVAAGDLFGPDLGTLAARLTEAKSWETRIGLMEAFLLARLHRHAGPPALVEAAWHRLTTTRGRAGIAEIAADEGVSRKHLTQQFRIWTGLAPLAYARVLRFERAMAQIAAAPRAAIDWSRIAASCDYYDQSHFNRDFRTFTGLTPTAYLDSLHPGGPVILPTH